MVHVQRPGLRSPATQEKDKFFQETAVPHTHCRELFLETFHSWSKRERLGPGDAAAQGGRFATPGGPEAWTCIDYCGPACGGGGLCLTEACFFRFHSFSTKRKYRRRPKASATRLQLISQSNYLNYCFALAQKEEARFKSRREISAQSPPLSTMHNNFDQALIVL